MSFNPYDISTVEVYDKTDDFNIYKAYCNLSEYFQNAVRIMIMTSSYPSEVKKLLDGNDLADYIYNLSQYLLEINIMLDYIEKFNNFNLLNLREKFEQLFKVHFNYLANIKLLYKKIYEVNLYLSYIATDLIKEKIDERIRTSLPRGESADTGSKIIQNNESNI